MITHKIISFLQVQSDFIYTEVICADIRIEIISIPIIVSIYGIKFTGCGGSRVGFVGQLLVEDVTIVGQ